MKMINYIFSRWKLFGKFESNIIFIFTIDHVQLLPAEVLFTSWMMRFPLFIIKPFSALALINSPWNLIILI